MSLVLAVIVFPLFLFFLFFLLSKKSCSDYFLSNSFECGYSSYFFSRNSFSIHYFLIGLVFLFLDLEICVMLLFFFSLSSSINIFFSLFFFCSILLFGLLFEIKNKNIEWFD